MNRVISQSIPLVKNGPSFVFMEMFEYESERTQYKELACYKIAVCDSLYGIASF